jgi:hypothetical protein
MDSKYIYFLFICMPIRILLCLLTLKLSKKYLKYLGLILLIPSAGFLVLYFTNIRKKGAFSDNIWWSNMRLLHGLLYLGAAIYAIKGSKYTIIPLLLDVLVGYANWINNYNILFN